MRLFLAIACASLLACGGKLADDTTSDASTTDVIIKKDAKPPIDTGLPDVKPPPPPLDAGLNVSGQGPGYESEDQIAVAPDGTIAILWSAFTQTAPYVAMQYSFSTDDGKTFSAPKDVITPNGLLPGDPAITVDAQGNFWASYLGIKYAGQSVDYSRVYVAEAPKGTFAFNMPVEISPPNNTTSLIDHPKIFVTKAGSLLVGWADFPNTNTNFSGVIARSTDGANWTRTTVITQPEALYGTFFWFCQGASAVYTTFLEATSAKSFISARASTDDGVTFGAGSTQVSPDTDQVAALDPFCAASGSDVWVMFGTTQSPSVDATTLDGADHLWIMHSGDGASTFDTARVDALDSKASQLATIPLMVRDSKGVLDVAYVAGDFSGDPSGSIRMTRTTGLTAAPSKAIDGPMIFDLSRTDQSWVGDYFGAIDHAGTLYVAYPRNETGLDHIYFAKVALP